MAWEASDWLWAVLGPRAAEVQGVGDPQLSRSWLDTSPSWVQQTVGGMGDTGLTADALRAIYQGWSPLPAVPPVPSRHVDPRMVEAQRWLQQSPQSATGPPLPARGYDPGVPQVMERMQAMPTTGTVFPAPPALARDVARQRAGVGPQGLSPEDWALWQRLAPQGTLPSPDWWPGGWRR